MTAPGTLLPETHHTCLVSLQISLFCICRQLLSRVSHPARCRPPLHPHGSADIKGKSPKPLGEGLARSVRSKAYSCLGPCLRFSPTFPVVAAPTPALWACWAQPQGFLLRPPSHPTHSPISTSVSSSLWLSCVPPAPPGTCWL